MTRYIVVVLTLLASIAWAGEEFLTPDIREGSAYESSDPKYRVVGMEDRGTEHTLFVVADPTDVLTQKGVNRIIRDIQRRNLGFTEIWFYSSVRDQPQFPAFAIYDHLAVYRPEDNKTYYGVAAKKLYGGWAYGPQR
jgi:hypothetical protein